MRRALKLVLAVLLLVAAASVLVSGVIDYHSRFGTKLTSAAPAKPALPLAVTKTNAAGVSSVSGSAVQEDAAEMSDVAARERPIAEPATVVLVGLGLTLFSLLRRRPEAS